MSAQEEWIRMTFRLPPEMHATLKETAERTGSSIKAEVIRRLALTLRYDEMSDPLETLQILVQKLEEMQSETRIKTEKFRGVQPPSV